MDVQERSSKSALISLSVDELLLLNNALNEIASGIHMSDADLEVRIAFNRERVRSLLHEIGAVLDQMPP